MNQAMMALARANEVKARRYRAKRELKAGRAALSDLFDDPATATMRVWDLLEFLPSGRAGRGYDPDADHPPCRSRERARRIIRAAGVSETRKVGALTQRERRKLLAAEVLVAKA